jgi:hypothetical protein
LPIYRQSLLPASPLRALLERSVTSRVPSTMADYFFVSLPSNRQ